MLRTSDQLAKQLEGVTERSVDECQWLDLLTADLEDMASYVSDLLSTIPNPVYVVSPAGIIVDGNKALEQLTGWPLEKLLGNRQCFLFGDRATAEEIDKQARKIDRLVGKEAALLTNSGQHVPVSIFSQAREDSLGNVTYVVALVDISKHKQIRCELEQSFFELAETISRALGCRDPYTEDHGRKVAKLSRLTGEKLGLTASQIQGLYVGSLLHDVGKIAVPEIILAKPGRLTEEEYNLIRTHTKQGYAILKDTKMPWPIADIAFSHHERLDGSGYPLGIDASKLSLDIRIIGVCDVVEAMSSHRPYRPRRTERQVMNELQSGRGKRYDTDVVDAVLEVINSGAFPLR